MEKDVGKIKKNADTDIVIRIDDFGGKPGLTIREFVTNSQTGYTGFTKSGTRIPAESITEFKRIVSLLNESDFKEAEPQKTIPKESAEEDSGIDEEGLM